MFENYMYFFVYGLELLPAPVFADVVEGLVWVGDNGVDRL